VIPDDLGLGTRAVGPAMVRDTDPLVPPSQEHLLGPVAAVPGQGVLPGTRVGAPEHQEGFHGLGIV
jgi:hypothetical protein